MVPDLSQLVALAGNNWTDASDLRQGFHNGVQIIRAVCVGSNASFLQPDIRRQILKELHGFGEVVDNFLSVLIVCVAARVESANTGAMLSPLMLPNVLV